ncbi:MAG: hypothetical protein Q7T73_04315 [Beijerinckiaceae bacterium]|nr:hypothetical protein [Beijerinckiaceae bacterium]
MFPRRSHRLRLDKPTRVLFGVLWTAPVVVPLLIATASPWLPSEIRKPAKQTVLAVSNEAPDAKNEKASRVRILQKGEQLIPGAAPIRVAGLMPASSEGGKAPASANHPIGRQIMQARQLVAGRHVFRNVEVSDNLRLGANGLFVALAGVAPVAADETCRRLDGVVEPCATRAINRLEILTRGRAVVCDVRPQSQAGEMRGVCKADKIDIAEDLVRNGLARRLGT